MDPKTSSDVKSAVLEAKSVYLLLKKDIAVSRSARVKWLLNHIDKIVTLPNFNLDWKWYNSQNDIELISVVPTENANSEGWHPDINYNFTYKITNKTQVWFLSHRYRLSICLDMSPSQATVDLIKGEIKIDEMFVSFKRSIEALVQPFIVPGSFLLIKPSVYLTVIAHTPFFTTPAQQVLIEGVHLTHCNVDTILDIVEKQLYVLEEKISQASAVAHERIDMHRSENERHVIVGDFFEDELITEEINNLANVPVVSPDASFINMLRYAMLALSLLPENSFGNILIITDGVVCMPAVNLLQSILQQLHYDCTAVSFLMVGSSYHPHCSFGYISYRDILAFIARATLGVFIDNGDSYNITESVFNTVYRKSIFLWSFHSFDSINSSHMIAKSNGWPSMNSYFNGIKVPQLLHKKHADDKANVALTVLLSRRLREGYTVDSIFYDNGILKVCLCLPWQAHTYLLYSLMSQWPLTQPLVHYQISIKAPYENLHDTTCSLKKQLKSAFRQAVVDRFWSVISQLTSSDITMAQIISSFSCTNVWFMLPESVKCGMAVFVMLPNIPIDTAKPQFTANDMACPQFGSFWQPICQLENTQWKKWFHIHRFFLILHHDNPLPRHLHLANASGRFTTVQCRQAVAALHGMLAEWASFVLIDNHSYVKFVFRDIDKSPTWFCIIRVTSKLPCAILNLGFLNGTPGSVRKEVCEDLCKELHQLTYSVRIAAKFETEKPPSLDKESTCCTIFKKPLEKILIRYERLPNDLTTVVFPDGTRPTTEFYTKTTKTDNQLKSQYYIPTAGALLTTLSRYLHHRRWIWGVSHPLNPKLGVVAIARILSTLTKMRLNEGFSVAHSSAGIINMVCEVEIAIDIDSDEINSPIDDRCQYLGDDKKTPVRCVIQYVLFPPHSVVNKTTDPKQDIGSNGSDDETAEPEIELTTNELQIVTEVWVEPQFGHVVNCPVERSYMQRKSYQKIADAISNVDANCINSLLTLEHLSLMCQQKQQSKSLEYVGKNSPSECHTIILEDMSYNELETDTVDHDSILQRRNIIIPLIEERIHKIPFTFDIINILPKCKQARLLFSPFHEGDEYVKESTSPNSLLLTSMYRHLEKLHDQELYLKDSDAQRFLHLSLKRQTFIGQDKNWCHSKFSEQTFCSTYPLWKCFIKGISVTRIILTFIPASLHDLRLLCFPETNDHTCYDSDLLILPIFMYDCPLNILINAFVNTNYFSQSDYKNDIYEDHTYKTSYVEAVSFIKLKTSSDSFSPLSDVNSDVSEESSDNAYLRHHSRILTLAFSKCYVASLFHSLDLKYLVQSIDVQAAVELCESTITNIDITSYLKSVCGHINKKNIVSTSELRILKPCYELRYLHNMIKTKFIKTIKETFHSVPSNENIYYCSSASSLEKLTVDMSSSNWESDDESSRTEKETQSQISEKPLFGLSTEELVADLFSESFTPLFLHFTCTVNNSGSISTQVLPTCLGEIIEFLNFSTEYIDLNDLNVTLDIICSTLPKNVQCVIEDIVQQDIRRMSFSSASPLQRGAISYETFPPDLPEITKNQSSVLLLPHQNQAISFLEKEIKWQLTDEIVTVLLDVEPVTNQTLNFVAQHISASSGRQSCQLDVVTLNFIYGPIESMGRFIEQFSKLPVPDYKLCKVDTFYYLAKDYPSVNSLDVNVKKNPVKPISPSINVICPNMNERTNNDQVFETDNATSIVDSLLADLLNDVVSSQNNVTQQENIHEEPEDDREWLIELDRRRKSLPNFWMILKVNTEAVTVYFHCRFLELETTQVSTYLAVHRSVISAIKSLCKHVNQFLLLQSLHDTRNCDKLLEPDTGEDIWSGHGNIPVMRNTSVNQLKNIHDAGTEMTDMHNQAVYLEASLKFMPGFFACPIIWETHFILHPRLKTSSIRQGLSRGIQALHTVLNKFSVVNRNNMFVYRDHSMNVFYLRLHENTNNSRLLNPKIDGSHNLVARSPSIASLPLGHHVYTLNHTVHHAAGGTVIDVRPRVRSFGEKESHDAAVVGVPIPLEDTITLRVHGVTGAGKDVTCDLVQVLQNRLDDAVLELLSIMLARNTMCKLTPADVHFLQKPFKPPNHLIKFSVQNHALQYLDSLQYYLHQNLLQLLFIPKYTDTGAHNQFRDYCESDHVLRRILEKNVFLYNQSFVSGHRGIACIAFDIVQKSSLIDTKLDINKSNFDKIIASNLIEATDVNQAFWIEFRIWYKGRVNIETLSMKLQTAVRQTTWDLIMEHKILCAPLCMPMPLIFSETSQFSTEQIGRANSYETLNIYAQSNMKTFHRMSSQFIEINKEVYPDTLNGDGYSEGNVGVLHDIYSNMITDWFDFGVNLKVPSVVKHTVKLTNRHPLDTIVYELQRLLKNQTNDSVKVFSLLDSFEERNKKVFILHNSKHPTSRCLLLVRDFEQWNSSCVKEKFNPDLLEPKTNKVLQKFSPLLIDKDSGVFISRQRLLLISASSSKIVLYIYNWSKDRIEKLILSCDSLGSWLSARASIFLTITAQKLGLFHNQPVLRKNINVNNTYLSEPEHLARFPGMNISSPAKDWGSRKQTGMQLNTNIAVHTSKNILEIFKDTDPPNIKDKSTDPVMKNVQEMQHLQQREKKRTDEQKKLLSAWQSRCVTTQLHLQHPVVQLLCQQSRVVHYCHTPLLFLPRWRIQSAATRDHSLSAIETAPGSSEDISEENWHKELCNKYFEEYKQYLQTLGFVPVQILLNEKPITPKIESGSSRTSCVLNTSKIGQSSTENISSELSVCYLQRSMLGGVLLFELLLAEPFFVTKLHALECYRIQNKTSKQCINQFVLSFLDDCDKIKILMHLHSFTYDFHLRCIYRYISDCNEGVRVCHGYHMIHFLDDFMNYYSKAPNFARNLVYAEMMSIGNLTTPAKDLFVYLLNHKETYNMEVLKMTGEQIPEVDINESVLIQITTSPQISYKDSHDRKHTDDFDLILIVSYSEPPSTIPLNNRTLFLKYYIVLTSRREIYPKSEIEQTIGKFRTVTSSASTSEHYSKVRAVLPTDFSVHDSIMTDNVTYEMISSLCEMQSTLDEIDEQKTDDVEQQDSVSEASDLIPEETDTVTNKLDDYDNECEGEDEVLSDSVPDEEGPDFKQAEKVTPQPEIRQESVNYLGYYSSHEQLMQQLILDRAKLARTQITQMVSQATVHCRTHLLWNKLVSKLDSSRLNYDEFIELLELSQIQKLSYVEPQLANLLNQPISWFLQLSRIITTKYADKHRTYVSRDGSVQYFVVLHPNYQSAFMLLSIDFNSAYGELYVAFRGPTRENPLDITDPECKYLIEDFINCVCFHVWVEMT